MFSLWEVLWVRPGLCWIIMGYSYLMFLVEEVYLGLQGRSCGVVIVYHEWWVCKAMHLSILTVYICCCLGKWKLVWGQLKCGLGWSALEFYESPSRILVIWENEASQKDLSSFTFASGPVSWTSLRETNVMWGTFLYSMRFIPGSQVLFTELSSIHAQYRSFNCQIFPLLGGGTPKWSSRDLGTQLGSLSQVSGSVQEPEGVVLFWPCSAGDTGATPAM